MSAQQPNQDMSRRIPENLGGTDNFFDNAPLVGAVQLSDGIVAFGPSLFLLFIFENILPQNFAVVGFFFSGVIALVGASALLAKPSYLTLGDWISDIRRFRNAPDTYRKALPNGEGGGDDEGGNTESIEVNSDKDTRSKIDIDRIYPKYGAIERPDESVVGIVRIRGLNLDAASQEQLAGKVNQFDDFINRQLQEDIQLYMPMRQFDPTKQVDMYEDRLENSRLVQNDPLLQEYISDRISFVTAMSLGSYIRRFYLICEVPKRELITEEAQAAEMKRVLEQFPLGSLWSAIYVTVKGSNLSMMSDKEMKTRQLERIEERRDELAGQIEGKLGCSTESLNADEAGVLLKEFWEGVHVNEDEQDGFIRRNPYVKGESDTARIEELDEDEVREEL